MWNDARLEPMTGQQRAIVGMANRAVFSVFPYEHYRSHYVMSVDLDNLESNCSLI
jgi:hypothetical protein